MRTVIRGEGLEPSMIVGAVAGDTSVDPDSLGNIDVRNGRAYVEAENPERLVEELENVEIGDEVVEASTVSESDVDFLDERREMVELEREEEMRQHEEEIRNLSGKEREEKGRAILHLRARDEGEGLEGFKVKFLRNIRDERLPENEISVGDLVMISKDDPLRDDNPTGTVIETTNYSITVAFSDRPGGWVYNSKGLRMDLYVNDITFQRMLDALDRLEVSNSDLQNSLLDENFSSPERVDFNAENEYLNGSQVEAVEKALGSELFLIHGPPGTGKTTTLIEYIIQEVERGNSVLATADSNTAVDNMVERLEKKDVDVVRAGHPARTSESLREKTLDAKVKKNEKYQRAEQKREEAFELKDELDDLQAPSGRYRRGMSDEKILELAEEGRGSRGVSPDKIQGMADWIEKKKEVDEKFEEADRLKEEAVNEIIEESEVVLSTNSTAGSDLLSGREFDALAVDEATQSTEPSTLIPINLASERIVMAGDHKQLPPTVKSQEAKQKGLEKSLFERIYSEEISSTLKVQYRMNKEIMKFPNQKFYGGKLEADESVRNHTLEGLGFESEDPLLDPEKPVTFLNCSEGEERTPKDSPSKENRYEASKVVEIAKRFSEEIEEFEIGVITPYEAHADLIKSKIDGDIEVSTVDGFQGREKELIIISFVRSNDSDNIGFLKDLRRLNVSLTRARRKLVMLGDPETLETNEAYRELLDACKTVEESETDI
jgi:predicted DNA helicase